MSVSDWKNEHANASWEAVDHAAVQKVMAEYADNMGFVLEGLPRYGLQKVAHYAAQVARAQALGFDPNLLRMTPNEANSALLEKAAEMVLRGVPTILIDPEESP